MSSKRSFTIDDSEIAVTGSTRFMSSTPGGAAVKAARRIFGDAKKAKAEVRFTLRETTRGSEGKLYRYIGVKEKLAKPKVVSINGTDIVYTHKYHAKSCNIPAYN